MPIFLGSTPLLVSGGVHSGDTIIHYPPDPVPDAPVITSATITPSSGAAGTTFAASYTYTGGNPDQAPFYQWYKDAVLIGQATSNLYQSTSIGSLTVEITLANAGGSSTLTSSAATVTGTTATPTVVGSTTAVVANGVQTNVTLPGPPIQGDVVFGLCGSDNTLDGIADGILSTGYETLDLGQAGLGCHLAYKVMGATPDTTVTVKADSNRQMAVAVQVFRGIDASSLDVPFAIATGSTGMPNAPAVTTLTAGALVIAFGVLDDDPEDTTLPSGFSNLVQDKTTDPTAATGATVMIASKIQATAGAVDPDVFGGTGTDDWRAFTCVLRPSSGGAIESLQPYARVGYGSHVTGGRGGKFVRVTSLSTNAATSGSLPWAFNQHVGQPLYIAICVEGNINFGSSTFEITRPNWTLDFRYAPGNGCWITGARMEIERSNFVMEHPVHLGNCSGGAGTTADCIRIGDFNGSNTVDGFYIHRGEFKHGQDEVFSLTPRANGASTGPRVLNGTIDECIVSDALPSASGSYLLFFIGDGVDRVTVRRNLMATARVRFPFIREFCTDVEIINCAAYNNSQIATHMVGSACKTDFVGNLYRLGPLWSDSFRMFDLAATNNVYVSDYLIDSKNGKVATTLYNNTPDRVTRSTGASGVVASAATTVESLISANCGPRLYGNVRHANTQATITQFIDGTTPTSHPAYPGPVRSTSGASYPAHTSGVPNAYLTDYPSDTNPEAIISSGAWNGYMVAERIGAWHVKP